MQPTQQRSPLSWPTGWKRTPRHLRQGARFAKGDRRFSADGKSSWVHQRPLSVADAVTRLMTELDRLGVKDGDALLSTNLKVRLDGLPYSNQTEPDDCGVACYFRLHGNDRVLACDTWNRVADNIAAIAAHITAIRAIDRYGVGSLDQAFAGYVGLPAKGTTWKTTLGFAPDADITLDQAKAAYRTRAREAHPDAEKGSHDAMASLNAAMQEAERELSQ